MPRSYRHTRAATAGTMALLWLAGCGSSCPPKPPQTPRVAVTHADESGAGADAGIGAALEPDCPRAMKLEREAVAAEVQCVLQQYVRLRTDNPPGNEIVAARFLARRLALDGIEAQIIEAGPGRANIYARLPATATSKKRGGALALMHHMDTVPASPEEWSVDPFAGEVREGYLWGRGAFDNKGAGAVMVVAAGMVKRLNLPLSRDLVLLGVADEEAGGGHGARFLVAEHPELFKGVEMMLNEGGGILQREPGKAVYAVEHAQKAPLWLHITATGPSGHASSPRADSSVNVLLRALSRLAAHRFEVRVLPEVAAMFAQRAAGMAEPQASQYRDLAKSLQDPAFAEEFLKNPSQAVMVQNTISITMLQGSDKENVLPPSSSAVADLRLLPGVDAEQVIEELKQVMNEPAIHVEPILSWKSHSAPIDTPLFAAIKAFAQARDPGAPVGSQVIGGFTDCNAFRARGITCYGFVPLRVAMDEIGRIHGKDERIALDTLTEGVLDMVRLLQIAAP